MDSFFGMLLQFFERVYFFIMEYTIIHILAILALPMYAVFAEIMVKFYDHSESLNINYEEIYEECYPIDPIWYDLYKLYNRDITYLTKSECLDELAGFYVFINPAEIEIYKELDDKYAYTKDKPFCTYTYYFNSENIKGMKVLDLFAIFEYYNCMVVELPGVEARPIYI